MSQVNANQQAAGGGGAVTVADGADVAQGSTADALGANTVIGQLKKIASAGGSAVSIADGSDVAEGATADAAITSDVAGTVSGKLRGLVKIFADVWDSVNHRLNVTVGNFPATQPISGSVSFTAPQHTIIDSASLGTVTISGVVGATLAAETTKVIGTVNQGTSPWVTSTTLAAETTKVIGTVNQGTSPWVTSTTLAAETTKVIGTVNIASGQSVALAASSAVIGHVIVDSGSITAAATLAAETTKVIGTVNIASGQTLGLAAGSQVIGHVIVDSGAITATLAAETTKVIGTTRTIGNTGATLDGAINGAAPTNALWVSHAPSTASAASCLVKNGAALTVLSVKASPGSVYGLTIVNKAATVIYIQFYNQATTPTLGTSVVNWIPVAASATLVIPPGSMALSNYATGIGIGASTTPTSTGTPGTAPDVSIWYI